MTSWRETTSTQAQADLDELLDTVLPLAEQTIGRHGAVAPFAAAVTVDGEVTLMSADVSASPDARDGALGDLLAAARSVEGEHRAFAFAAEVGAEDGHRVQVDLEHREGVALQVVARYSRSRLRRSVKQTDLESGGGHPIVWPAR